ncbi:MAG: hypothetical protein IJ366_09410 [Clostridia bacterium]|nr:hypothetical protein [Clostridia bacterium]
MQDGVRNLAAVTCYSYDRQADRYSRKIYSNASCHFISKLDTGKRAENASNAIVRIFTDSAAPCKTGDRIALYASLSERPPDDCYKVISVTDNRRAINQRMRHWRVEI